ncbi:Wzz/FepE/Etk N-terminal domain-containing protein [Nitrococcus mobilis]|uniref:Polysaccharide chain length determinant N-terminal domain-containing protein n=1 Tax=Nitrococcus mobilis Nb-231 TaxID=314278 RepID=A4BR88_9GAMM|nr:Wzz/FepE/Etk N-terminal domain-containing protein [Nitrococcus mobilis]EAR21710.1 hypothetical protein NB231_03235 [Nitrococcus mobilis Nb-231]
MPLLYASDHDDEISLIDLWIILVRRKWTIAGVLLLCVLLGLAWVLVKPPRYQYETAIQIGEVLSGDALQPIEPVGAVLAKIQETYIPLARARLLAADAQGGFKLKARSPEGSALLIVVSGEGVPAQRSTYLKLLHDVLQQIQVDLSPRFKAARQATEREREGTESRLQQLTAEAKLVQGELERLGSWNQVVERRLQIVRTDLQTLREQRNGLLKRGLSDSADMRLIVLNGDIRTLQETIADLQEQLGKWIPAQRDGILSRLKQNQVDQSTQQLRMQEIEARAAALQPTRAVLVPQRLPEPIGTGPVVILALAGVLGLMLGVFAAFFTEFLARANAVMKSSTKR